MSKRENVRRYRERKERESYRYKTIGDLGRGPDGMRHSHSSIAKVSPRAAAILLGPINSTVPFIYLSTRLPRVDLQY